MSSAFLLIHFTMMSFVYPLVSDHPLSDMIFQKSSMKYPNVKIWNVNCFLVYAVSQILGRKLSIRSYDSRANYLIKSNFLFMLFETNAYIQTINQWSICFYFLLLFDSICSVFAYTAPVVNKCDLRRAMSLFMNNIRYS